VKRADSYYVQFCISVDRTEILPATGNTIGLDVGLKSFYTDSNGTEIENPKFYRAGEVKRVATLLKKQKGKCTFCGNYFKDGDSLEVDHIIPKSRGGKNEYKNWQLLHRHCHDPKTASDGSSGNKSTCNSGKPKPPSIPETYFWIDDMLVTTCY